ncbi:MAG TPA: SigB/SigF/SigG family RNA polymerase sigma factor [Solirubrobacteraceae bacterium]|nr:SigB/SigF/SigG family RNA polymerase sigma factor [Solirubrobacteraceae bacterium]
MEHAERTRELLRRWHEDGDRAARQEVAESLLPLARSLARHYAGKGEPLEDLEQVASVGLLNAIDRFDMSRDVRFATFAVPTIAGELKRHFRDRGWMLRVPRDIQELSARVTRCRETLTREHGRSPTVGEVASALGESDERILDALRAADAYRTMSLDEPLAGAESGGVLDAIGGEDDGFARAEERAMLDIGLETLAPREREVVRLRYYEGMTQREIARAIGVSQMHVSRLIRRSVDSMRETIAPVTRAA